jgi:hypothetical protein
MSESKAYDKAKYHDETVANYGLPESHASHHIVFFFRWLIERDLISEWLRTEMPDDYAAVRAGRLSALDYFDNLDRCLCSDMLTEEGNAFAQAYFDYDHGRYLSDLVDTLQGNLPSEFHIPFNNETYARLKPIIDKRYAAWKAGDAASVLIQQKPEKRRWWQIWK